MDGLNMFSVSVKLFWSVFHLVSSEDLHRPSLLSNPFEFINKIFEMKWHLKIIKQYN